jgi:hypothetical protein
MMLPSAEVLQAERTALHAANYVRGRQATELVEWVQAHGCRRAAEIANLTRLQQAVAFTNGRAPKHHQIIDLLIALRAVLHVEGDAPPKVTPKQAEWLRVQYDGLSKAEKAWTRQVLSGGGAPAGEW